ncbi:MAG: LacI family DNA-binding transcriptional regulator [Phycisphaeraceae bacterium]|nr:LacI family DNA-binding transcriptional regulator [Phycisphaeraceae bacterium]
MASVREIARLTNVSPSTVSKVINGRPGVNANTAKTVRRALESTNYQPAFKAIDWNRFLVVTPNYPAIFTKNTYVSTILAGIAEQASEMGTAISVKKLPRNINTVTDMKHMLLQDGSAGIILLALRDGHQFADLLGVENLPHVIVGETVHQHKVNQIVLDDAQSATRAMTFLIEQGHQRIGVILGHHSEIGHLQRLNACKQTMQKMLGDKGKLHDVACLSPDMTHGQQVINELFDCPKPPTAIFCFDHATAVNILNEANHRGIKIPQQLSLISYVNDGTVIMLDKQLTSLWVPTHEMGRQAVCMLQKQLDDNAAKQASARNSGASGEGAAKNPSRHQTTLMLPSRWTLGATTAPPAPAPSIATPSIMQETTTP